MEKVLELIQAKLEYLEGRSSKGIRGISLKKDDKVISLTVLNHVKITSDEARAYLKKSRSDDDTDNESTIDLSDKKFNEFKSKEQFILTVTENGYGKRSSSYEF